MGVLGVLVIRAIVFCIRALCFWKLPLLKPVIQTMSMPRLRALHAQGMGHAAKAFDDQKHTQKTQQLRAPSAQCLANLCLARVHRMAGTTCGMLQTCPAQLSHCKLHDARALQQSPAKASEVGSMKSALCSSLKIQRSLDIEPKTQASFASTDVGICRAAVGLQYKHC